MWYWIIHVTVFIQNFIVHTFKFVSNFISRNVFNSTLLLFMYTKKNDKKKTLHNQSHENIFDQTNTGVVRNKQQIKQFFAHEIFFISLSFDVMQCYFILLKILNQRNLIKKRCFSLNEELREQHFLLDYANLTSITLSCKLFKFLIHYRSIERRHFLKATSPRCSNSIRSHCRFCSNRLFNKLFIQFFIQFYLLVVPKKQQYKTV